MQKNVTIITIVLMSVLVIGVATLAVVMVNSGYNKKATELEENIQKAQDELDTLKEAKDKNGFTPTEVIKAFYSEVKSDAVEKAKLYLAPDVQSMDTKATLKLGNDLSNTTTGESFEEDMGTDKLVNMTFVFDENDTTVRVFTLSKYDDIWKITGVTAE